MPAAGVPRAYEQARKAELTYVEVGATRDPDLPAGYHHLERRTRLGHGAEVFDTARAGLLGWAVQRRSGATVYPPDAPPTVGLTVLVGLGLGAVRITARCRVVWVVDEPGRVGFGYGTLPGHPERGEESFVLSTESGGDVWFTVRAFSRPATWYARLGAPVTAMVQRVVTERYLRALSS
ncbi:MAG: DUF1990 family protein [Pseudonocardia sp.]